MKKLLPFILCILTLNSVFGQVTVTGCTGAGNGSYTTLTAAATAIVAAQPTANIVITITGNTTEPASGATLVAGTWTSLTIMPSGGSWTISGAITSGNPLLTLNGSDNVTINGLNTGGNALTISNTTVSATSGTSTIKFITDATNNTITNCSILGSSSMNINTNGGNIWFAAGAVSTGNDNNTISYCNIGPASTNLPGKCIYMNGTTTSIALNNSGNIFTNNNIYDFFGPAVSSGGIYIGNGNTDNNITNNKFYQTATRTQTSGTQHSPIWIANSSGNNFQISGNTIGYSNSSGTGAYTVVGLASSRFIMINLLVGSTTATSIQNNTIAGIDISGVLSGTSTNAPFRAIYVSGGTVNIGDVNGNTIGSITTNGSINFTSSSSSASDVIGIYNLGNFNFTTNSNNIGGFTAANSGGGASNIYCLRCTASSTNTWTCNNNIIGGNIANSINSTSTAAGTTVIGILTTAAASIINGNTIRNLTAAGGTGPGTSASVVGIHTSAASTADHTVTSNIIHSLSNTNATDAVTVSGIIFGSSTGTNLIAKNIIHSFSIVSSDNTSAMNGIYVNSGTATYQNNMIRLGIDASGNDLISGIAISGINETVAGTDNFYFNSIYIGGSGVGGSANTFAFNSSIVTNTRSYRNNIFANTRTNGAGTGKHYAVTVGGAAPNPAGLTINYNDYYVSASSSVFGSFNLADVPNFSGWKTAVGQDVNSWKLNPQFLTPNGNSSTVDLHINAGIPTPIEGKGVNIATITDDFDSQTRASLTPEDIGADALDATPLVNCAGTPASSNIIGAASVCINTGTTLSLSTNYTDIGISYQWKSSAVTGGPYNNNLGTNATQTTGNLAATTYYVCTITCTNSGLSYTTAEKAVIVIALPNVSVTPISATYCTPGGAAVALTASNADNYTWSPAAGLSATTGANVTASPLSTTTYTVTGTDGNGCVNTASTLITVNINPQNLTATATPNIICSGNTVNLTSSAYLFTTVNNYLFTAGSGTILDPMTGANIVISSDVDDTPSTTENIGFTFNYDGTNYTNYSVSPDGWLLLGGATAVDEFTNLTTSSINVPKIYAYWDDMATGTTGSVQALVTGSSPNRIFKIQWYVTIPQSTFTPANSTFQVWLYETSNKIEFRYGSMGTPTSGSISSGLTGAISTNYNSITFSSNTSSNSIANDLNSIVPASGTIYTFSVPETISYSWTPSIDVVNPTNQNTVTNTLTTSKIFTITASNSGCSDTANVSVTVSSGASIITQPVSASKCIGDTATFNVGASGAGLTYQWRKNTVNIPVAGNPSAGTATLSLINVSYADTATYDVVVSSTCGSPATSNGASKLTVKPVPTATASSNSAVCEGTTLSLSGSTDFGTSFNWNGPGGYNSTSQNLSRPSVALDAAGNYSFTASFNGCVSAISNTTVTVNPTPSTVTVTPSSASICSGTIQQLTAGGGNVNINFVASSGAVNLAIPDYSSTGISNAINAGSIPAGAIIDSVIVTVNVAHTWDNDVEVNLQSPNGKIINLFGDIGLNGDNFTNTRISSDNTKPDISASSAPFTGTFRAQALSSGLIGNPPVTTSTFSDMFSVPNGNWTIMVYDDASGETGTLLDWSIKICYKASSGIIWTPLTELYTNAGATNAYTGGPATTVYAKPTSDRTYTANATSGSCSNSGTSSITVKPTPTANITVSDDVVCAGDSIAISIAFTGTGPWLLHGLTKLKITGGTPNILPDTLITVSPFILSDFPNKSAYYFIETFTDNSNGCTNDTANWITITVNPIPTVTITLNDNEICAGDSVGIYVGYTGAGSWIIHGATKTIVGGSSTIYPDIPTSRNPYHIKDYPAQDTYYHIEGLTDISTGCRADTANWALITVHPLPVPIITGNDSACVGSSKVYSTEAGMSNYLWLVSPAGTITAGGGSANNSATVLWNTAGAHKVSVLYSNSFGCISDTIDYFVTVKDVTVPTISGDTHACIGSTLNLYQTESGMSNYQWAVTAGGTITSGGGTNDNTATITWNNIGAQTVSVLFTNSYGCAIASPVTYNVDIYNNPFVFLGNNITVCADQEVPLDAGNTGASYVWTPGDYFTETITVDSNGLGLGAHNIVVMVSSNGCVAYDTIVITFDACTGVANNNDGINISVVPNPSNGLFYLNVEGIDEKANLSIYNMEGKIIYSEQVDKTRLINKPIDLKSYPKGMYFIRLVTNNYSHTEKIIIE